MLLCMQKVNFMDTVYQNRFIQLVHKGITYECLLIFIKIELVYIQLSGSDRPNLLYFVNNIMNNMNSNNWNIYGSRWCSKFNRLSYELSQWIRRSTL